MSLTESEKETAVIESGQVDRSGFPGGPWVDEPDTVKWVDCETGYTCAVLRQRRGHLCGYVELPEDHPLYGVSPNSCAAGTDRGEHEIDENIGVSAHGGITFAGACPDEDRTDESWWYGFDCIHAGDKAPGFTMLSLSGGGQYRDLDYVIDECRSLARQIKQHEGGTQ